MARPEQSNASGPVPPRGGPPGAAGQVGEADDRFREGHHGGMLGVARVGDAEQVRRDRQGPGDVTAGREVMHGAAAGPA